MGKLSLKDKKLNNVSFRVNEIDAGKIDYYCEKHNISKSKFIYNLVMEEVNKFCNKDCTGLFDGMEEKMRKFEELFLLEYEDIKKASKKLKEN